MEQGGSRKLVVARVKTGNIKTLEDSSVTVNKRTSAAVWVEEELGGGGC